MGTSLFFAVIVAILLYLIVIYNRLITLRNRFKNAFAQIDVQLQRRHDLIPNLVESAKAYMEHERETLIRVAEARTQADGARRAAAAKPDDGDAIDRLGQAETALTGSLVRFRAVSESYPELKANEQINQLMEELSSTENRIGFARQAFNDSVMNYNTFREQFPNNFIGGLLGSFQAARLLRIETPDARRAVKVAF